MSPSDRKPTVFILHGDDPLAVSAFIDTLKKKMGDESLVDLNTTRLDGRQSNDEDLHSAVMALPFLAERRLVILDHPLARLTAEAARTRFIALLEALPESTALVLVIPDEWSRRDWGSMPENHWLRQWAQKNGGRAFYKACAMPQVEGMPVWIRKRAKELGGEFSIEAAKKLAEFTGSDTLQAEQEMTKLLTYVDFSREVEADDVMELCSPSGSANVFDMVDALGARRGKDALRLLHELLDQQDPFSLFGMIVRQFRLLLQAREVLDESGRAEQVTSELRLNPFVARKICEQAAFFTLPQLENTYHRLLDLDEAMKTSQMAPDLALETFVVEQTN